MVSSSRPDFSVITAGTVRQKRQQWEGPAPVHDQLTLLIVIIFPASFPGGLTPLATGSAGVGTAMNENSSVIHNPMWRAEPGDQRELTELFEQHRERLTQMVRLRMDRRLQGRVDAADVLQEAYLECAKRFADYRENPSMPLFL